MFKTKKILTFLFIFIAAFSFVVSSTLGEEKVPGSFTTRGERSVPIVTVLGLYNAAGQVVNPGGGTVTPNTRHSIRFRLTNETHAFENISIRLAFFQSEFGDEADFDAARTNDYGDALVIRVDSTSTRIVYAAGSSADTVTWDDTHFSDTLHKDGYASTDNSFDFEIYFNMSKVASSYVDYYIGVSVDQTLANDEVFSTYEYQGHYSVSPYTEFDLDTTNLSLDWSLGDSEAFFDFDGFSSSSRISLLGTLFSIITNQDVVITLYADTTWSGQDLDDPTNPDAIVEAYLEDFPSRRQEFSIFFSGDDSGYVSGNSQTFAYIYRTSERAVGTSDLLLSLELFDENFENGVYEGSFYFDVTQSFN